MKKNILGRSGIEVTELCFGALPMGPLQKNVSVEECTELVASALKGGINFIDTAQMYRTYEPIKRAIQQTNIRPVIATKSAEKSYEGMQVAIYEALSSLDVEYIDIFLLHAARADTNIFEERSGALKCLVDNKEQGRIKAIGISTHSVAVTRLSADVEEVDIVFPIINLNGRGILEGTSEQMKEAISLCAAKNKGVYLMKALAGGSLVNDYHKAMTYVRSIQGYASIAMGMVSQSELEFNLAYFNASELDAAKFPTIEGYKKQFVAVKTLCKNCGTCIEMCPNNAICELDSKAHIDQGHCLQCGYCVGACPEFAIRII